MSDPKGSGGTPPEEQEAPYRLSDAEWQGLLDAFRPEVLALSEDALLRAVDFNEDMTPEEVRVSLEEDGIDVEDLHRRAGAILDDYEKKRAKETPTR